MKQFWTMLVLFPWYMEGQALFTKVVDPNNPATTFPNTVEAYKGVAWIDLDHDNRPDLFACQRFVFHNEGNGQFTRLGDLPGITYDPKQISSGSSWGDLDNDGDPDCIVTSLASGLFRDEDGQTFTAQSGVLPGFGNYSGWDCALADVDNNGRLDALFVHANNFHPTGPYTCRLFLQDLNGAFTPVTGYEFTDQLAPYTIPTWVDFDLDGDMDLFIGSGPAGTLGPDYCYKNLFKETGAFALQRITSAPFNAQQDGQTYNFIDYDNDGGLDFCLTNYAAAPTRFFHRNPSGSYSSVSTPFTVQKTHLANVWGDVDNDGDLDVLITSDASGSILLYRNNGDGTFAQAKTAGTVGTNASGIALADYDNDGDLDFYTNGAGEGRALFRNDTLAGNRNWIQLTLEGQQSNRSAIGAVVRVKANMGGTPVWQIRQVLAHNSFQSQSDLRQHFGLNDATVADSVEVRWPSGLKEVFTNLQAGNFYTVREGQGISAAVSVAEAAGDYQVAPNPVVDVFRIARSGAAPEIESLALFDACGRRVPLQVEPGFSAWQAQVAGNVPPGVYTLQVRTVRQRTAVVQIVKF